MSDLSMDSEQLEIKDIGTITFKTLLERLDKAEKNYEQLHAELKLDKLRPQQSLLPSNS